MLGQLIKDSCALLRSLGHFSKFEVLDDCHSTYYSTCYTEEESAKLIRFLAGDMHKVVRVDERHPASIS